MTPTPSPKRLKIVIPYRDRESQLSQMLPHLRAYLSRAQSAIPYCVVIAEQEDGLPFNRGAMKNAGFLLGQRSDYTCFHDVDYLLQAADYGWADAPAGVALPEDVPTRVTGSTHYVQYDKSKFFGGVVLMPDALFRQVNGYSNKYWGWGYEDTDLVSRFKAAQIDCIRRDGRFRLLHHDSDGYEADGTLSDAAAFNRAVYMKNWRAGKAPGQSDGLTTLAYEILSRENVFGEPGSWEGSCERIKLRLAR